MALDVTPIATPSRLFTREEVKALPRCPPECALCEELNRAARSTTPFRISPPPAGLRPGADSLQSSVGGKPSDSPLAYAAPSPSQANPRPAASHPQAVCATSTADAPPVADSAPAGDQMQALCAPPPAHLPPEPDPPPAAGNSPARKRESTGGPDASRYRPLKACDRPRVKLALSARRGSTECFPACLLLHWGLWEHFRGHVWRMHRS